MKLRKTVVLAIFVLPLAGCEVIESAAMSLVKDLCSCVFVDQTTVENCKRTNKENFLLASEYHVDTVNKIVTGRALDYSAEAKLISPRLGCMVTNVKNLK